ncbi:MAG: type II toxin-antitoxin system RelE/ParE family toxin [Nisaea sp.]|uniref:type II toxin-antitoxin system RelE/ParE family toxin n=1 Tax=Nisaea sp. TaxID=2024842 RepID=UPI001B184380|nr:type II toxin-antitoxin system RelE/ParE family toxin [Nisaea sp.]MBO6561108.1 type II toxin-antitoxin system RelE/ParE family toxin [Nisaea sp.]
MGFRFHAEAVKDLNVIYDTIAEHDLRAAARMVETLYRACRFLGENPDGGRRRSDLHPDLRSFSVGEYLLLYRVDGRDAEVVFVAHGRRDLAALVEREER